MVHMDNNALKSRNVYLMNGLDGFFLKKIQWIIMD